MNQHASYFSSHLIVFYTSLGILLSFQFAILVFINFLSGDQWFSIRGIYTPGGTFGKVWKYFWLSQLGVGACCWHLGIMEPEMLLNSPHCTGQNPTTKKYPSPDVSSGEAVKRCCRAGFYPYHAFPPFPTRPVFFSQNLFPGSHCFSFCNLIKNLGWYFLISKCRKKKSHGSLLKVSASSPHLQIFWHVDLEWPKILHLKKAPR